MPFKKAPPQRVTITSDDRKALRVAATIIRELADATPDPSEYHLIAFHLDSLRSRAGGPA